MKKISLIGLLSFLIMLLNACKTQNPIVDNPFERVDVELQFSITSGGAIDEAGTRFVGGSRQNVTKTFQTNPSRVAVFSYDALDMLDYVGIDETSIQMIGFPKSNLPQGLKTYDQAKYFNLGTLFIPDWDALDLFLPELIILGSRSTGAYDRLSLQFPDADIIDFTIEYGDYIGGFERNLQNLGLIFPSIRNKLQFAYEKIASDMEAIHDVARMYHALFIMVNGESLSFYGPNGRFAVLHDEFGFRSADPNAEEGGSHGNVVGYEYVRKVNPEILFLLDRGVATGGSSTINQVRNNALIKQTTAGINQDIYVLDASAWYLSTGGIQSTMRMIEDLQAFIQKYTS